MLLQALGAWTPLEYGYLPAAVVVEVEKIEPHRNADNLEVMTFWVEDLNDDGEPEQRHVQVVTGKHYRERDLGVWFRPGAVLPGYLANEMWLSKTGELFEVRAFPICGTHSEGIFGGSVWRKTEAHDFEPWSLWQKKWSVGDDVSGYFGVGAGQVDLSVG